MMQAQIEGFTVIISRELWRISPGETHSIDIDPIDQRPSCLLKYACFSGDSRRSSSFVVVRVNEKKEEKERYLDD